ncbi:MAG: 30S ribosomal protein S8 [Gammaproteobacteria bacterium]|nr:30S ribosomal protein S8 [Gammaproteobacteria bacterium]
MSLQDPIADMLSRIWNAQGRQKRDVSMPMSKLKAAIAGILKQEGYINDFHVEEQGGRKNLRIELKYYEGKPVIERLQRVSRPGLRRYRVCSDLPPIRNGLGIAIISTPEGLVTDKTAREKGIGGELLCIVT